jgi:hypothetical protein
MSARLPFRVFSLNRNAIKLAMEKFYYRVWKPFGFVNAVVIASTNIPIGMSQAMTELRKQEDPPISIVKRWALMIGGGLTCMGAIAVMTAFKTAMFYLGGPIGTYRIGLGLYNHYVTGDQGWLNVLVCLGSSAAYENTPYLVKPMGTASWKPVRIF